MIKEAAGSALSLTGSVFEVSSSLSGIRRRVNVLQIVPVSSAAGPLLAVDRLLFERLE